MMAPRGPRTARKDILLPASSGCGRARAEEARPPGGRPIFSVVSSSAAAIVRPPVLDCPKPREPKVPRAFMTGKMTIALDAMGGDAGPEMVLPGAHLASI